MGWHQDIGEMTKRLMFWIGLGAFDAQIWMMFDGAHLYSIPRDHKVKVCDL